MNPEQAQTFVLGDSTHSVALVCSAALMAAWVLVGEWIQSQGREQAFTRGLAWFGIVL